MIVAPRHWKRKGSSPIALPVYDVTTPISDQVGAAYGVNGKYTEVIKEAIALWGQCPAFKFIYSKITGAEMDSQANRYGIYFRNYPEIATVCWIDAGKNNIMNWCMPEWMDSSFLQIPDSEIAGYEYRQMQYVMRHEMGHALGLDHVYTADGYPDAYDCMGSGLPVTQHDLDTLKAIYGS